MNIAVVGAGYAGLAVAWHLLQKNLTVTIFDGGEGASHVSTGLLHKYPGKKAIMTLRADEGVKATMELLEAAGSDTFWRNGILRTAINEEQKKIFGNDQIFIPDGITVFSRRYLAGLKKACKDAKIVNHWVHSLQELDFFDRIVLTTGASTQFFPDIPLKKTIGQCLICRCKEPLTMSLLSQGHITPTEESDVCMVGSTYEHTNVPDREKALGLLNQVAKFYPPAKEFKVLEIASGVRISPKVGYEPILKKVAPKTWVFTGLGSRGLIYHSLLAKALVDQLQ